MTDRDAPAATRRLGAVVLTGGTGVRLGGVDKASIRVGGVTLLESALAATADALDVVVVGDPVATTRPVTWAREDPPGGGPAAGLLAGLDALTPGHDLVAVLAVDMPRVTAATFTRLRQALTRHDVAVLVDRGGRRQPLCAVYLRRALERVRPANPEQERGLPMHRLLTGLSVAEVPALGEEAQDVDTWDDVGRLDER